MPSPCQRHGKIVVQCSWHKTHAACSATSGLGLCQLGQQEPQLLHISNPCCCCCSFTLEASFAGPNTGTFAGTHYDTSQLESIGANLALALLDYSDPVQLTQAATAMKTAQQVPREPAGGDQQGDERDCESSGSLSDAGTAVSTEVSSKCEKQQTCSASHVPDGKIQTSTDAGRRSCHTEVTAHNCNVWLRVAGSTAKHAVTTACLMSPSCIQHYEGDLPWTVWVIRCSAAKRGTGSAS